MPVVSQSIPNFLNGVSQQTPTQRGINQGAEQINFSNDIVKGLSKRPPLEYIATLDNSNVFPNTIKTWSIQRDESNKYICAFYNGGVRVFDLQGNEKTVSFPNGTSYLNSSNPKNHFRMVNIADFTFVVNKSITPTANSSTSPTKIEEFLVYCKTTQFGRTYSVTLGHAAWSHDISVQFTIPNGANASTDTVFRDTDKVKDILLYGTSSSHYNASASGIGFKTVRTDTGATLSSTNGLTNYTGISDYFDFESYDSVIYGKPKNQNSSYTITTSDGSGGVAMYHIRDSIQDFSKLPYYAKTDVKIKITGDEGDTLSDYFVAYQGDGVWSETIAPGTSLGVTDSTMPHALVNNNNGTFTFKQLTFDQRKVGDAELTNPDPSFVGKTIQNLTFYKNRLGILSGENLILSGNAEYFNFFATTITQVLDTDPIDIACSGTTVNTLKNSVSFNETLLLFSDTTQYKLNSSGDAISPLTAILNEVSVFEHTDEVAPIAAGKYAYFCQTRTGNTAIREYYSDDDTLTNDGLDITVAVQDLIPENPYQIISNNVEDLLITLCSDTADSQTAPYSAGSSNVTATNADTMFIYKYFYEKSEKVQSAWSKWVFNGVKILGGMSTDSYVYILTSEGTTTKLFRIDLRNLKNTSIGFNPHVDLRTQVTGSYSSGTGLTTVTSPYGAKTGLIAIDFITGKNYPLTYVSGSNYTLIGNHTNVYLGVLYESLYTLSTPYIREQSGRGLLSITSGRYQIRNISFDYENSGFFQIEVTPKGRSISTKVMNGYVIGTAEAVIDSPPISTGTLIVPIQCKNTEFICNIKSSSHLPMNIASAEVEGYYTRRSNRV